MRSAKELTIASWMDAFRNGTRVTGFAPELTPPTARRPVPIGTTAVPELELDTIDDAILLGAF